MEVEKFYYDNKIVRNFAYATILWGVVGMLVGLVIALQLAFPVFNFKLAFLTYGRIRPIHTNAIIFAFVGNAIFTGVYYSMQRLLKTRMYSTFLSYLHFWGWQLIIVLAAVTLALGFTMSKEYAELEWPIDILIAVIWLTFGFNMFGTIAKRRVQHLYVAIWFYLASFIAVTVLHVVNSIEIPVSLLKSYPLYAGVQDAIVQWWYGHNAVAFFLTTPFLGLMYYFLPKEANRPIYSYRMGIIHFWALVFIYIWSGPHHLLYQAVPNWAQTLGVIFSVMLIAPSWGGMINGLLTLRGAWDKVRESPTLKFMVVAITAYGMATFEGPMMSTKMVNTITHFTDWTIAHTHIAGMAWNGFLTFSMLYWLIPRMFRTKLYSIKLANIHFWIGTLGILLYAIPLYWAAITQSLMWKEFTPEGFLRYPNFMETLVQILPMYYTRIIGGVLYFAGALLFVYNMIATIKQGSFLAEEEASAPALEVISKKRLLGEKVHGWLERKPIQFTAWIIIATLVASAFSIVPFVLIKSNESSISSVKPYTPLELTGRDIYLREGCYTCHSQMVRPFRSETERYGEYAKAGEFVYDHPFQWGSRRSGPDLLRTGVPGGKMYKTAAWHFNHMLDPQKMNEQSIMPPYPWLISDKIDVSSLPAKIRVMRMLGVPYPEGYDKLAEADLMKQADSIAAVLKTDGIEVQSDREIIALIAYMHKVGRDISTAKPVDTTTAMAEPPTLLTEQAALDLGKEIFNKNCIVCHGALGQGNAIGPNIIDNFWINGGDNKSIYHIISNGKIIKGMQAWKDMLSKEQLQEVFSYSVSLIGTPPPADAKAPQGQEFIRQ
jgi:cytochrome c oxidase cbb3-type subunit I/II